jgi:hypothetical protein
MAAPRAAPSARFEFPSMLYDLLEECTFGDDKEIVSWEPHGHTFKIHNREQVSFGCYPHIIPSTATANVSPISFFSST